MSKTDLSKLPKTPTSLTASTAEVHLAVQSQGESAVENQVPRARRSAFSQIKQACIRRIDTLAPSAKRLARENADLRDRNEDLRTRFQATNKKRAAFVGAAKPDDGSRQWFMPKAFRLREDNKRLEQENADIGMHIQARKAINAADAPLSKLFAILSKDPAADITAPLGEFAQAIQAMQKGLAHGPSSAIDMYTDRLPLRLEKETPAALEAVGLALQNLAAQSNDPVVGRVYFAIAGELIWREDFAQKDYGSLSLAKLIAIRDCSTLFLEEARDQGLMKSPTDTIRGTHLKPKDLELIVHKTTQAIPARTVLDADITSDAWNNKSVADLEEVAWAIGICAEGSSASSAALRQKLMVLDALVKKHQAAVQSIQTNTGPRLRTLTAAALVSESKRWMTQPGFSKIQRETGLKLVADEITRRHGKVKAEFQAAFREAAMGLSAAAHPHTMHRSMDRFVASAVRFQTASVASRNLGAPLSPAEESAWIREVVQQMPKSDLESLQRKLATGDFKLLQDRISADPRLRLVKQQALDHVARWYAEINAALPTSTTPIPLNKKP